MLIVTQALSGKATSLPSEAFWTAVAVAVVSAVVAVWTTLKNQKASPYEALANRVVHLESKVEELEQELRATSQRWGNWAMVMVMLFKHHAPGVEYPQPPYPIPMDAPG